MPIYQFQCPAEHEFERYLASYTDANPECTVCGEATERVWRLGSTHVGSSTYPLVIKTREGPVEIRDAAQHASFAKERGLVHRPDASWIHEEQSLERRVWHDETGRKRVTNEPVYKGPKCGFPGVWV